jgi:hypothetical protein
MGLIFHIPLFSLLQNHSTFLDIIIAGLVGLRAALGATFVVQPLVDSSISYFALDNLAYHNHNLTIAYDPTGSRGYAPKGKGTACKGLCVWADGVLIASSPTLTRLNCTLPVEQQQVSRGQQESSAGQQETAVGGR